MLGKTEELVLLATHKAGSKSTASEIYQTMEATVGRVAAFGAIFTTLERLKTKGFLTYERGGPRQDYGGRMPRLYTLTGDGVRVLSASMAMTSKMAEGLELPEPEVARAV